MNGKETIEFACRTRDCFVTDRELEIIAKDEETRLQPVLVRLNCGRYIAAAQDAILFNPLLEKGDDACYIRDVRIRDDVLPGLQHQEESRVQDILEVEGLEGLTNRIKHHGIPR